MKKIKLLSILFVICSTLSIVSCESEPVDPVLLDNNPNQPTPDAPASFTANLNGSPFVANTAAATIGNGLISIGGFVTSTGASVGIVIQGTTTGSYTTALMSYEPTADSEYTYSNLNLAGGGQLSGGVVITQINTTNHTISGTFSFTGWYGDTSANLPPVEFTNGVFTNIPYTTGVPMSDDVFKATVDGTAIDYVDDTAVAYTGPGQFISITGVGSDHTIHISVKDDLTPGTYPIVSGVGSVANGRYTNAADEDFTAVGTVTIVSKTATRIKGTFSFTTNDPATGTTNHTITNGEFDVEYDF